MTVEETKKRLLEDDDFVLSELSKLQELFKMKKVIRYHHTREEIIDTESVAEHVYGMMILIDYFLPLEQIGQWDGEKIFKTALYHDIDEILTGDRIGYLKTQSDREQEKATQQKVVESLPLSIQQKVDDLLNEYDGQASIEARFTRAIDKIEPLFHLINDNGKKICVETNVTLAQSKSIKDKYVKDFPYIKRFNEVLTDHMIKEGYFSPEQ
ncbi:hypothetical protein A2837_01465 [Candidatus Kaiserbacteria bacterium RIFCSPHIGHO2_01_FULL_46_22]|uniref:5'-deoxynucleotidase n=1 Tax=Candidatus Kaiserbacteria bacterium RIFCSPHIGHO2_01_FULL_46_22 TaxID=1798475 RepID=A0A1F6BYG6_9BACT|nr:MAG: hypothetical protein A2837_01465 [Candidatus Kaiserbacteria bacterium RIFCSPHIGHO2_01_FULL_46_22]